jgi:hypothetical protein
MGKLKLGDVINSSLSFSSDQQPSLQTTALGFCGSFEDTSAYQASAGTTSATLVTINSTTTSVGVTIDSGLTNSKITFANGGQYFFSFDGQFRFSGGASSYDVTIWYSKNNSPVTNSSYTYTLTGTQGSQILASVRDIVSVNAGDYIQFYWYTSVSPSAGPNGIYLYTAAAGSNPSRPDAPNHG